MHINKGKAYGRQGKAPTRLNSNDSSLLTRSSFRKVQIFLSYAKTKFSCSILFTVDSFSRKIVKAERLLSNGPLSWFQMYPGR